jgi:hypothetical protein
MIDPTGHQSWRYCAEMAEKYFSDAKNYDTWARMYKKSADELVTTANKQKVAPSVLLSQAQALLKLAKFYEDKRDYADKLAWIYKEDAAKAYNLDELRRQTEDVIEELLNTNAEEVRDVFTSHYNIFHYGFEKFIDDTEWFYNKVRSNADWDYKLEDMREADPILAEIAQLDFVYYDGQVMTWEEFGNYHYGYVGEQEFSLGILYYGSEYAQGIVDYNERTDQRWIEMGYNRNKNNN